MMRQTILTLLLATAAVPAFACTACFGDPASSQTQGMNAAILTLLGTTLGVLACAVFVAGRIMWRAYHPLPEPEVRGVLEAQPMTALGPEANPIEPSRNRDIIVEGQFS